MTKMAIELTGLTSVTINGIDLTPAVTSVRFAYEPDREPEPVEMYRMGPVTWRGKIRLTPAGHLMLFGRRHPRIRRMHEAYSRRHGRGR